MPTDKEMLNTAVNMHQMGYIDDSTIREVLEEYSRRTERSLFVRANTTFDPNYRIQPTPAPVGLSFYHDRTKYVTEQSLIEKEENTLYGYLVFLSEYREERKLEELEHNKPKCLIEWLEV